MNHFRKYYMCLSSAIVVIK